jgi:hypothetical protein
VANDDGPELLDLGVIDEPPTAPVQAPGPGRPGVPRRALLALGGLAAVGGGVALVRSRGSAPPSGAATPSPTTTRTATVRPSLSLPPGQVVVTQLPDPILDGPALDLFGFSDNALIRVELARGRVTRTSLPALADIRVAFVPIRGGVLVHREDGGPSYLVRDGRRPEEAPPQLSGPGPMLPGPDLDHVWVMDAAGATPTLRLLRRDGRRTGTSVALPRYSAYEPVADGAGYALIYGVGGAYSARPEGLTRVTTGAVMATGRTGWLALDCDEHAVCSAVLVDRSGRRRAVAGVVAPDVGFGAPAVPDGALAPDGRTAALYVGDPSRALRLVLVDLGSGDRMQTDLTLVGGAVSQSLNWSPDGRWLFGVDSSARMVAVDPPTGRLQLLVPDTLVPAIPVVRQVAVR